MRTACLALLLATAMGDSGISTRVYPQVLLAGGSVWLTCRVTPNEKNRTLVYGIIGTEQEGSERQLDGYGARITWGPTEIKRIPCGAGDAYCLVVRNDGTVIKDSKPLTVSGCDDYEPTNP